MNFKKSNGFIADIDVPIAISLILSATVLLFVVIPAVKSSETEKSFFDNAILDLAEYYNDCREKNIKLRSPESTIFPVAELNLENIQSKNKYEVAQILYQLSYLCLQENEDLLKLKGGMI